MIWLIEGLLLIVFTGAVYGVYKQLVGHWASPAGQRQETRHFVKAFGFMMAALFSLVAAMAILGPGDSRAPGFPFCSEVDYQAPCTLAQITSEGVVQGEGEARWRVEGGLK